MFSSLSSLPMRGSVSSLSSEAAELMEQPSGGGMAGGWIRENIQFVSMSVNHGAWDVCKGKINLLNHNKEDVGQTHDKCHGVLTGSRFGHCNMLTHTRSRTHTNAHRLALPLPKYFHMSELIKLLMPELALMEMMMLTMKLRERSH